MHHYANAGVSRDSKLSFHRELDTDVEGGGKTMGEGRTDVGLGVYQYDVYKCNIVSS